MRRVITAISLAAACMSAVWTMPAQQEPATYRQKMRTIHSAEDFTRQSGGKVRIRRELEPKQHADLRQRAIRWPVNEFTVVATESPSVTWVGTRKGAIRVTLDSRSVEYFAGLRWLPDDHVTGIGFDGGVTWLETPKGFSRIEYKEMTLAQK